MKSVLMSLFAAVCLVAANDLMAAEMPALAKQDHCTDCHAIDKQIIGPSWMDVARRYKDASEFEFKGRKYPLEEGLVMKVSKGGAGNWGTMPMPFNDPSGAKQADYQQLVRFILNLAKE